MNLSHNKMCTFRVWVIFFIVLIGVGCISGILYIWKKSDLQPDPLYQKNQNVEAISHQQENENLDKDQMAKSASFVISSVNTSNLNNIFDGQFISELFQGMNESIHKLREEFNTSRHKITLEFDEETKARKASVKLDTKKLLDNISDLRQQIISPINSLKKSTEFLTKLNKLESSIKEVQTSASKSGDNVWSTATNFIKIHVEIRKLEIEIDELSQEIKRELEREERDRRENIQNMSSNGRNRLNGLFEKFRKMKSESEEIKPVNMQIQRELNSLNETFSRLHKMLQHLQNHSVELESSFPKLIAKLNSELGNTENSINFTNYKIQNQLNTQKQITKKEKAQLAKDELNDLLKTVLEIHSNVTKLEPWPDRMDFHAKLISLRLKINNALHFVSSVDNAKSFQLESLNSTLEKLTSEVNFANQFVLDKHKTQKNERESKKNRELEKQRETIVHDVILALRNGNLPNLEKAGAKLNHGLDSGLVQDEDFKMIVFSVYSGDLRNFEILDNFEKEHLEGIENGILLHEALYNELVRHNQTFTTEMVRLGHRIKEFQSYSDYSEIDEEYKNIFTSLFTQLPTCVKNLLTTSVCLKGDIRGYARTGLHSQDLDSEDLLKSSSWEFIAKGGGKTFLVKNNYDNQYLCRVINDVYMAQTGSEWRVQPKNDKEIQLWQGDKVLQGKLSNEYSKAYGYRYKFYLSSENVGVGSHWEVEPC